MMMKPSKYNYITRDENGDYLVCNLIKGRASLRRIHACDVSLVNVLESDKVLTDEHLTSGIKALAEAGFLINEQENELFMIDTLYENRVNMNCLNLIIMTTGQCNFRCRYCYEDFQQTGMTIEVQKRVLKCIQRQFNDFTKISIEWFGGEPLVEKNVIENIMRGVDKISTARKVSYRSGITTNGYLLTPAVFEKLYSMKIFSYQVTLDGDKQEHDSQRVLSDGTGTFDRIVENLRYIRENKKFVKANIIIRVNLTKPIVQNLSEFLAMYKQHFANDKRFSLEFKQAGDLGTKDISEFRERLLENQNIGTHDLLKQYGIFDSMDYDLHSAADVLTPMSCLCYASFKNSYVIGPDGVIYKCTVHFDKKINQIGYIDDAGDLVLDQYAHSRWYRKEKGLSHECLMCKFLPVCYGGGCTYYANFKRSEEHCSNDLREHVEDYIKYLARFIKVKEIIQ